MHLRKHYDDFDESLLHFICLSLVIGCLIMCPNATLQHDNKAKHPAGLIKKSFQWREEQAGPLIVSSCHPEITRAETMRNGSWSSILPRIFKQRANVSVACTHNVCQRDNLKKDKSKGIIGVFLPPGTLQQIDTLNHELVKPWVKPFLLKIFTSQELQTQTWCEPSLSSRTLPHLYMN